MKIDMASWALDNRKLINFLIVVLILGGIYSLYSISKLEDPELAVPQAVVVAIYPGASAHQVELEVTDVLEKNIRAIGQVSTLLSSSQDNMAIIQVGLKFDVLGKDVFQMWNKLRNKISDTQRSLPDGVQVIVMDDFGDVYGMFYAITNDGYSQAEFQRYISLIRREIENIEGISKVSLYGMQKECINIELHQDRMANLGVLPFEVLNTLDGQNKSVYAGYYESGDFRIPLMVSDRYQTPEDIAGLLIQGHEKDQMQLKDIADVYKGIEKPVSNELLYDGAAAVGLSISAESGTDITKLGRLVEKKVAELQQTRIPAGIAFHKVFFQSDRVNYSIKTFMINLVLSVLIVMIVLMLAMGFKSGLILGTSLIVIIIGSIAALFVCDGTMQRVSLGSFILAMGMLVDNGIVILDGIQRDMQRGLPRREALSNIGKKTAMPLLGATLIAIIAFLPLMMSPDITGVYIRDLFIVLAVSLLLSWLLAMVHVPIQADRMLHPVSKSDDDFYNNKLYGVLHNILYWGLKHRWTTVICGAILVAGSLFAFTFIPREFFPDMAYDQLYIEYKLPEGTSSSKVKADLAEISDYLYRYKEITHITTSIGGTPCRYNLVRSLADPSMSYGELIVDYTNTDDLVSSIQPIQDYLIANYPQAYVRVKRYNLMYRKYPIEVRFTGPDPAVLRDLTAQAMKIMEDSPKTILVCTDWEPKAPVMTIDYNQAMARSIGLSRSNVGLSVMAATGGIPVETFYEGDQSKTVYLKTVDENGQAISSLEQVPMIGMLPSLQSIDKQTVIGLINGSVTTSDVMEDVLQTSMLSQVATGVKLTMEDPVVIRYNGERAMRAQCNAVYGESVEGVRKSIAHQIEAIPLPAGYSMNWEGEHLASKMAMEQLFMYYPLAILLMIGILILLFKDYKKPLVILCCVALLPIGVVLALAVSGKALGFVAIVGILGLVGMMIKNGIVLMDEIHFQLNDGQEPIEALLKSSAIRFRPVMMASLTTILGMIPLLRDQLFGSLAVTIMGGLLIGTLITLVFLPVLYAVFFNYKVGKKNELK